MDEQIERENIQVQCLKLSKYFAKVRTASVSTNEAATVRRTLQLSQSLVFNGFISMLLEHCFHLIGEPEKAIEIAQEELDLLHTFLEEYTDLLEEEYNWCK